MKRYGGESLDNHALAVLKHLWEFDIASTTDVTNSDSIDIEDHDKVRYRLKKLADAGLINVSTADVSDGGGKPPKKAEITRGGEEAVKKGLLGNIYESDINGLDDPVKTRLDELDDDIEFLLDEREVHTIRIVAIWETLEANGMDPYQHWPDDI